MIIDIHCHYTLSRLPRGNLPRFAFERDPGGDDPTACDSCIAPRTLRRWDWLALRRLLRLPPPGLRLDAHLRRFYADHLIAPSDIDRHVLLAFDACHADDGTRPPLPTSPRALGSDMYTSNSLIADLCRRHPDRLRFGCSVHPYRRDARAAVDECLTAGACLMKWMPLHQNIDPADPRTRDMLVHCADRGLPLLIHYGPEAAMRTNVPRLADLATLLPTLRELHRAGRMPITIIAHVGTPAIPTGQWSSYRQLLAAWDTDLADAPLYADISALLAWGKIALLDRLARRQELHPRLLFGTDFPVPPARPWLAARFARSWPRLRRCRTWPELTLHALRAAGFNEIVFRRAAAMLPHIDGPAPSVAPSAAGQPPE